MRERDKGGNKMKKLLFGTMLLALVIVVPIPTMAAVDINVAIPLPPPIASQAPPDVIAMPDTNDVYAAPDINADLFFWNGWWWRLWEGRWYRSHYYNQGWGYYNNVPSFYFDVDPGWRGYYRDHNWNGHRWNYERIPNQRLQQNWKSWHNDRHWEKQGTWGVQGYQPRPQKERQAVRQQRQKQYQQRPEVQQHQPQRQEQRPSGSATSGSATETTSGESSESSASRRDKSKDLRLSNRNTLSLKENPKGGRENIKSRITKSLEKLPPVISMG
jgi:hypothetical protein